MSSSLSLSLRLSRHPRRHTENSLPNHSTVPFRCFVVLSLNHIHGRAPNHTKFIFAIAAGRLPHFHSSCFHRPLSTSLCLPLLSLSPSFLSLPLHRLISFNFVGAFLFDADVCCRLFFFFCFSILLTLLFGINSSGQTFSANFPLVEANSTCQSEQTAKKMESTMLHETTSDLISNVFYDGNVDVGCFFLVRLLLLDIQAYGHENDQRKMDKNKMPKHQLYAIRVAIVCINYVKLSFLHHKN